MRLAFWAGLRWGVLGLVALGVSACGSDSADDEEVDSELPVDWSAGTFMVSLEHDGLEREAIVYVPESYDPSADTPLMLNFHGFYGTARYHMEAGDLRPQADRSGGILVVPQGADLDGSPHWNPSQLGGDNKSSIDDFGFLEALLDEIQLSYPYSASRVSAVGYSNGGMMAMGLACERSERIASVASISGTMLDFGCEFSHPISVMTIHGTRDDTVAYDGDGAYRGALDVVNYWRDENNTEDAERVTYTDGNTTIQHWPYEGGDAGTAVHHYKVVRGEHIWLTFDADGRASNDILWDFLTAYSVEGRL